MKRPMFRKGGNVGQGIMNKVERKMYADGPSLEELATTSPVAKEAVDYAKLFEAAYGPQRYDDIISNLLIRGGMGLVERSDKDEPLLRQVVGAYRQPTEQALAEVQKQKMIAPQARVLGVQSAIKAKQMRDLQRIKALKGFESGTEEARKKSLRNYFKNVSTTKASALKINNLIPKIVNAETKFGDRFYGVIDPNQPDAKTILSKIPNGQIILHYDYGTYYIMKDGKPEPLGTTTK